MKDLEKEYLELKKYLKNKLEEADIEEAKEIEKEILEKIHIAGITKNANGEITKPIIKRSWRRLVNPPEEETFATNVNRLAYSLNKSNKRSETIFITFYSLGAINPGYIKNFKTDDGKIIELGKENKLTEAFPIREVREGRETFYFNINKNYNNPLYHKIFNSVLFEVEAVNKEGETKKFKNLIGKADRRMIAFHKWFGLDVANVLSSVARPEDLFAEARQKIDKIVLELKSGLETKIPAIYIEENDFKTNLARAIALAEVYPFTAFYSPRILMNEPIYREAINRGLKHQGLFEQNWMAAINVLIGDKFEKVSLEKVIETEADSKEHERIMREKAGLKSNKKKYGELSLELIEKELEEARKEIKELEKKENPEPYSQRNQEEMEKERRRKFVGEEEGEEKPKTMEEAYAEMDIPEKEEEEEEDDEEFPF